MFSDFNIYVCLLDASQQADIANVTDRIRQVEDNIRHSIGSNSTNREAASEPNNHTKSVEDDVAPGGTNNSPSVQALWGRLNQLDAELALVKSGTAGVSELRGRIDGWEKIMGSRDVGTDYEGLQPSHGAATHTNGGLTVDSDIQQGAQSADALKTISSRLDLLELQLKESALRFDAESQKSKSALLKVLLQHQERLGRVESTQEEGLLLVEHFQDQLDDMQQSSAAVSTSANEPNDPASGAVSDTSILPDAFLSWAERQKENQELVDKDQEDRLQNLEQRMATAIATAVATAEYTRAEYQEVTDKADFNSAQCKDLKEHLDGLAVCIRMAGISVPGDISSSSTAPVADLHAKMRDMEAVIESIQQGNSATHTSSQDRFLTTGSEPSYDDGHERESAANVFEQEFSLHKSDTDNSFVNLNRRLDGLQLQNEAFEATTTQDFQRFTDQLEGLEQLVGDRGTKSRDSTLDKSLNSLREAQLQPLTDNLRSVSHELRELQDKYAAVEMQVSRFEQLPTGGSDMIENLAAKIEQLSSDLSAERMHNSTYRQQILAAEPRNIAAQQVLMEQIEDLQSQFAILQTQYEQTHNQSKILHAAGDQNPVIPRLAQLQAKVEGLEPLGETIAALQATVEGLQSKATGGSTSADSAEVALLAEKVAAVE
eukprot:SAG31_NODE_2215_length_6172_cov_3.268730_4_plen_657_part_01